MSDLSSSEVDEVSHFDLLRRSTDTKNWINLALSSSHSSSISIPILPTTASSSTARMRSLQEADFRVNSVLSSLSFHSQQLSSTLETSISQCITRLPRTTLELNKMVTDTVELQEQLQTIQSFATTSSSKGAMAKCIHQVKELRATDQKLRNCVYLMKRAREIESRIKRLDGLRSRHRDPKGDSALDTNSADRDTLEDIPQLAETLYDAKSGLVELRRIEPGFASHYDHLLEDCEQWIQDQLKERCLLALIAQNVSLAAPLFKILYRVGRSSEVLKQFHAEVSRTIVSQSCESAFFTSSQEFSAFPNFSEQKEFSDPFMKSFLIFLKKQISFWMQLSAILEQGDRIPRPITGEKERNNCGNHFVSENSCSARDSRLTLEYADNHTGSDQYLFLTSTMRDLLFAVRAELSPKLISAAEACRDAADIAYFFSIVKNREGWEYEADKVNEEIQGMLSDVSSIRECLKKVVTFVHNTAKEVLVSCLKDQKITCIFCDRLSVFVHEQVMSNTFLSQEGVKKNTLNESKNISGATLHDASEASRLTVHFTVIENTLRRASDIVLSFFPQETTEKSIISWAASIEQFLHSLEVEAVDTTQSRWLNSLTLYVKLIHPLLLQCKVELSKHLSVSASKEYMKKEVEEKVMGIKENNEAARMEEEEVEEEKERKAAKQHFQEALDVVLWVPLEKTVAIYIEKCENVVKRWILEPLLQKTANYHSHPMWRPLVGNSNSVESGLAIPSFMTTATCSASKPVRDLGEAIIEIPVTLDTIRALGVASASNRIWMEEVIEDVFERWLDEIVRAAVVDFVEDKVLKLQLEFSSASAIAGANGLSPAVNHQISSHYLMTVWEQLRQDLKYLKNVVNAVRNDHHDDNGIEILDRVNSIFQGTTPPSIVMEGKCTVKWLLSLDGKMDIAE